MDSNSIKIWLRNNLFNGKETKKSEQKQQKRYRELMEGITHEQIHRDYM